MAQSYKTQHRAHQPAENRTIQQTKRLSGRVFFLLTKQTSANKRINYTIKANFSICNYEIKVYSV